MKPKFMILVLVLVMVLVVKKLIPVPEPVPLPEPEPESEILDEIIFLNSRIDSLEQEITKLRREVDELKSGAIEGLRR